ncbi:probable ATP-dependent RNA helicase DHX58 [Thalassophryne amazonica]|uniref:probable ATP-dependent RNA helicase DHX58 n=1 Tax=Thalassophryne amazonica TaxID=390379 RepID=UPI001471122E|nr:probable ATP-dependent RNA helicase DHX58 [Thalassophryne amazonica]
MAEFKLYDYQEEVVQRALRRENIIIWLPTGSGKTRAAVYVAKKHLETNPQAKVVVLVNKVHLVDQHYTKEFKPHLGQDYTLVPVSGESEKKDFFGRVLKESDVVICTAEILYNALISSEDSKHAELSDITLLIMDECHHTRKKSVYNEIMGRYLVKKLGGERPLPQILGLTASPGTGGAKTLEGATNNVLQICANLDSAIVSVKNFIHELKAKVPRPTKSFDIVESRPKDPFGDHLKMMMQLIHAYMDLPEGVTLRECGTQQYEADVILLEKQGTREKNRLVAQCARHLKEYNNALFLNDTLRMIDAYDYLVDFYHGATCIDGTDLILVGLFKENLVELKTLAKDPRFENPKMAELQSILLDRFSPGVQCRGIIFTKTRKNTQYLTDWVCENKALKDAGIRVASLTGAGNGSTYMTQSEQGEIIRKFRQGRLNLLISTSVAEEGLDIPECNLVVRYGLLTNEIAQQQAKGRARAKDSVYSVVAERGGREEHREHVNEYLEDLTGSAIAKVQEMDHQEFLDKITKLQNQAVLSRKLAEGARQQQSSRYRASAVQLLCRNCYKPVAFGSDIKLIENVHHVNVNPNFKVYYKTGVRVHIDKSFEDWEPGCTINCNNGSCNRQWGFEMKYKKVALLPILSIKNFVVATPDGRELFKKWKEVPFTITDFSFEEYCQNNFPDPFS